MTSGSTLLAPERIVANDDLSVLVTWQHPVIRNYEAVGVLTRARELYEFRYLERARGLAGFRPFLGFGELEADYRSPHLFPLFAERVLNEARPDRLSLFQALDLVEAAGPLEFLARSGGRRAGDTIELLPIPEIVGSWTRCTFLVHGVRYQPGASDAIGQLAEGQRLALIPDVDNEHDERAVLVTDRGVRLGWVPGPLLDYVRAVMDAGRAELTVVRANPPEFGHHLRLLVRLEGTLPTGYQLPWVW